jgi:hypothetical protein
MDVKTYLDGSLKEYISFNDLEKENTLEHDFKKFDTAIFIFGNTSVPYNRVAVNQISFGYSTTYTLRQDDMLEAPVGYREKRTKSVSVKIFTYYIDEYDNLQEKDDENYYTKSLNDTGERVTFENQLISTEEHAKEVAEWLGNYYSNNVSYEVSFRGEPRLNATDIIHMESDYLNNLQVEIEQHDFTYNGAFGGKLSLRRALRMN